MNEIMDKRFNLLFYGVFLWKRNLNFALGVLKEKTMTALVNIADILRIPLIFRHILRLVRF